MSIDQLIADLLVIKRALYNRTTNVVQIAGKTFEIKTGLASLRFIVAENFFITEDPFFVVEGYAAYDINRPVSIWQDGGLVGIITNEEVRFIKD